MHEATGLRADDYLARFVESTDYLPAIERWASPLLEEVRGIGEGAGIPFRDIYAYQLMDEEWLFRTDMLNGNGADTQARRLEHCSVIGICGQDGSAPILAQNMDLPKYYDGAQALLRITHQGSTSTLESLESFVFTAAGLIGTLGLNNQGIGLCVNTLTQLSHTYHGLPVAFVTRRLLESRSIEEAVGFVRDIQHASGQNYAIGGPDGIVDFECSARKAVQFAPHSSRFCHTNHPLANDDKPARQRPLLAQALGKGSGAEAETGVGIGVEAVPATTALSNSEQRYVFLDRIVSGHGLPAPRPSRLRRRSRSSRLSRSSAPVRCRYQWPATAKATV